MNIYKIFQFSFFVAAFSFLFISQTEAKTVHYELTVRNQTVNLSGLQNVDFALTVNGGIPAPTLEFTEGDDAEILVKNEVANEEVSIHWHGLLLPPLEDGVAYVNTPPIFFGQSRLFKFKIRQNGTFWYHSHTMLQEQKGVYGAIIIHPKKETYKVDKEAVVVISDWSDEDADQILKNLRKDGDYYLYKKNSIRSYLGASEANSLKSYLSNEWNRMGGMDLSDVGYDAFLINGKKNSQLLDAKPGERIRLRIINAAASTYFYVSLGDINMNVISADGVDIDPQLTKELFMGMAETYDVLFTVPSIKNYELRATAQDVTGYASTWIGQGEKVSAADKPKPDPYMSMDHSIMNHSEHSAHTKGENALADMDHSKMNHDMDSTPEQKEVLNQLSVENLKAKSSTTITQNTKTTELRLELDGSMERYVWFINGKTILEDTYLYINEGDLVRITFANNTMMHHPMHLHGHFFRVLNKYKDYSPLKHTVDVPPHGSRTIEFLANEPGQWMLHCHNLYHMKTGMARIVKYNNFTPPAEIIQHQKHDPHLHEHKYYSGSALLASNRSQFSFKVSQTWSDIELHAESTNPARNTFSNEKWDNDGDLIYRRWISNYTSLVAGGSAYSDKGYFIAGIGYLLPMMVESQVFINQNGKLRIDLAKRFQWTSALFSDLDCIWRPQWDGEHGVETKFSLFAAPNWNWSGGFTFTNNNTGLGLQYRF